MEGVEMLPEVVPAARDERKGGYGGSCWKEGKDVA